MEAGHGLLQCRDRTTQRTPARALITCGPRLPDAMGSHDLLMDLRPVHGVQPHDALWIQVHGPLLSVARCYRGASPLAFL
jgi:hypothetical protein